MKQKIAEKIKYTLAPEARGIAASNSFLEFVTSVGEESIPVLYAGYRAIAGSNIDDDDIPSIARRKTCDEIATILWNECHELGPLNEAIGAWKRWAAHIHDLWYTNQSDGRLNAMRNRAKDEVELLVHAAMVAGYSANNPIRQALDKTGQESEDGMSRR